MIADYTADFGDPGARGAAPATAGVVEHGLFPAALVSDVVVGRGAQTEHRSFR